MDAPYPPATGAVGFASGRGVDAEMRASSAARSGVGARLPGNPDRDGGRDAGISDEDMRADSMPSDESSGVRSAPSTRKQSLMLMQEGGLNSVRVRARRTHRDLSRRRPSSPNPSLEKARSRYGFFDRPRSQFHARRVLHARAGSSHGGEEAVDAAGGSAHAAVVIRDPRSFAAENEPRSMPRPALAIDARRLRVSRRAGQKLTRFPPALARQK